MQFDVDKMAAANRYELLLGTVVPRPIALVVPDRWDGEQSAHDNTYIRLFEDKSIARSAPLSRDASVRHAGPSGDTGEYDPVEVLEMAYPASFRSG
jgi:hypothetical protein